MTRTDELVATCIAHGMSHQAIRRAFGLKPGMLAVGGVVMVEPAEDDGLAPPAEKAPPAAPERLRCPSLEHVIAAVSEASKIPVDQFLEDRKWPVAQYRQLAMFLARDICACSLPALGASFGKDHTTVFYAIRQTERRLATGRFPELVRIEAAARLIVAAQRQKNGNANGTD